MNKYDRLYKQIQYDGFKINNMRADKIISDIESKYNLPYFDEGIKGLNKLFMLLVSEYSDIVWEELSKYDYNFISEIQYLIANYGYGNQSLDFLRLPSTNKILMKDSTILVDSKLGKFTFNLASSIFFNIEPYLVYGECHYVCHNFILVKDGTKAVTSLLQLPFTGYQYHSYIDYNDDYILDLSHNCMMKKDEFEHIFKPIVLNSVSGEELEEKSSYINSKESLSKDKELLLRLAVDKQYS